MKIDQFEFLAVRHWPTQWNIEKRLQGRTDVKLHSQSIVELKNLSLNTPFDSWQMYSSPLQRAYQTASFLKNGEHIDQDSRLIELNFGHWEGHVLQELRLQNKHVAKLEAMGLDMRPPEGETPREVQKRALSFLQDYASNMHARSCVIKNLVIVTHRSLIRALLATAIDWDMKTKCPIKMDKGMGYSFIYKNGALSFVSASKDCIIEKRNL